MIKCPMAVYGACVEGVDLVRFGEHTKSAKRGKPKLYIKCPVHGSIRLDKDQSQVILERLHEKTPEPQPEAKPEQKQQKITSDWGF